MSSIRYLVSPPTSTVSLTNFSCSSVGLFIQTPSDRFCILFNLPLNIMSNKSSLRVLSNRSGKGFLEKSISSNSNLFIRSFNKSTSSSNAPPATCCNLASRDLA